jgi:hypothetical protein
MDTTSTGGQDEHDTAFEKAAEEGRHLTESAPEGVTEDEPGGDHGEPGSTNAPS